VQEEFLHGCRLSFSMVMKCFASGSLEDVASCMTERMKKGFQQTLDEYKEQGLVLDYDIAPVDSAEIISIRFFVDEMGNDRVHVDVEFLGKQKFTLRDRTNRAVGEEGDWQDKSSVWRFESPLPELKWELVDLP
jgi:predicted lipid-binding transport protein (Tim44 family)